MSSSASLQSKVLTAARSEEDYRLYKAGLEWDLTDPIVIESREDMKSVSRWRDHVEPFNHQVSNLMTFCRRLPVTLLADDVGLGKTISAGLIMSELITRSRQVKTLIVCPKILGPQWKEELETKFQIPATVVTGQELLRTDPEGVGAIITTYQTARTYLEQLPQDRFEMLVLDEAHKLRNLYGTPKPPQTAKCFHKALKARRFRFVLMLTATPIQNRLWDLYSLVDLLTVARGHDNPFGSEGMFARKFIEGDRDQARKLKPAAAVEFRSIVYGYMSRVRRGDAKLHFPDRKVQLHQVDPTAAELSMIALVGKGIEKLNRLAQISILQALTSSPDALNAQLQNMARNRTVEAGFAAEVKAVVEIMPPSAKLNGLGALINQLKLADPNSWRLVIFTGRRETQTTIVNFLEQQGLPVGIINGTSGPRNQETLTSFRANPPDLRVIASTEAGSEGVNLQVANVLVNYDLPWNPMIVEQRIGRIQRLASVHASVGIFNITLKGTFEEYIVGRLMEKLQMSTTAIGDIESLLQGAVGPDEGAEGFEEKIRQLVVAALQGADVEATVRQAAESIEAAKRALTEDEKHIDEYLSGGMDGTGYVGPKAPTLPKITHAMPFVEFALNAFASLRAKVTPIAGGVYLLEDEAGREAIRFSAEIAGPANLYLPGSPSFSRLVQRVITSGVHEIRDLDQDQDPRAQAQALAKDWISNFGGTLGSADVFGATRRFDGKVLVRVRATVAHDSYERLVEVDCAKLEQTPGLSVREAVQPLPSIIEAVAPALGVGSEQIIGAAANDPGIAEFSRFYLERRAQEVAAAGTDERKREKMLEDFTPRIAFTVVGAEGEIRREIKLRISYRIDGAGPYLADLALVPSTAVMTEVPALATCYLSERPLPVSCLARCAITGHHALKSLLKVSELSGRLALPEHTRFCEATGKRAIVDELEQSAVTGRRVGRDLLRASAVSGKRAEVEHFARCAFTGDEALKSELQISGISGKLFRADSAMASAVSNRLGHRDEFVTCFETRARIGKDEAERCAVTGAYVRPGILETCTETGTRVLPSELLPCAITGRRVLRRLLVTSSVSANQLLERESIRSAFGKFCAPIEARACVWSGRRVHPEDLRTCTLTGIDVHFEFVTPTGDPRLEPLVRMLDGLDRGRDRPDLWDAAASRGTSLLNKAKCRVDAAIISPANEHLAMVSEIKTMLGLKTRCAGFVYSAANQDIVGRIAVGKRGAGGWSAT